ncbi:bifunctional homocysteine S-methyltransferase/methylenetetrahydrofolate reductase [Desulfuromonas sp. AOP6]|uniref:bifunctional homocysteine S-methyltransferase/methylenetetrahydrofolate reductase n=1 Tax=Desulfuromonas sp. AOP6 TaxID=1566351 RepID=UPI00128ABDE1|nr:bifunctional homocysteine S-methyltransferase/methylenetetrahydrofolate reductase [Desulfuromonas sp. AOP6]BCA80928.1 bifunctional homocysteineS-methyltransferase/methylenetetrahydrofolate reductase [Desulfuromonas sp. AOP6]
MSHFSKRSQLFLDRLASEVIVGDGAMGTLLYARGVPLDANFEYLNLINPALIEQVHRDYAAAGAMLLETNTFGANALRLGTVGLEKKVRVINESAARLARTAAGADRFVAGSVGPLIRPKGEQSDLGVAEKEEIFRQQMEALAEGGVDLFLLETFSSIDDLELAVGVGRSLGLPVVAQMAFVEEGNTREGGSAEEVARRLTAAGAAVIGANCGSGPREILRVLERMAQVSNLPLSAFANSGFPQYVDGRYIYLATPEYFAAMGRDMVAVGASLLGGCCGTSPDHIRALAQAVAGLSPVVREPVAHTAAPSPPAASPSVPARPTFLAHWGRRPVVTVELDPPKGLQTGKILVGARMLSKAGVDAISLAENPLARIRMSNIALARIIQEEVGIEAIVHLTGRDRNLIGLHSELMGAHHLGIRNVLAVTGDPVSVGNESGATSVFDLNSIGILKLLSALNAGRNLLGADLGGSTDFLVGAAFNPNAANLEGQLKKLEKKIEAGARFVQTQPVYSLDILARLVERTAPYDIPVLVGILPLVSERNAEFLHNEVPGIVLPDSVRERMRGKTGEAGVLEGMNIAGELIAWGRGKVGGYYLMPPFGRVELAMELLKKIRSEQV